MNARLRLTRILLLPVAFLALATHHVYREGSLVDTLFGTVGFTLLIIAAGGRIWASAYLAGKKDRILVTDGPYSMTRNPLYFFSLLGFIGAGLAFGSITMALVFLLVFFATHWPAIGAEERMLHRTFGAQYEAYCERVPRFFPRPDRIHVGESIQLDTFRFSRALLDCMAIPFVFIAADVLEWAKLAELLPILFLVP